MVIKILSSCCLWFLLACLVALGQGCATRPDVDVFKDVVWREYMPANVRCYERFSNHSADWEMCNELGNSLEPTGRILKMEFNQEKER